MIKYYLDPPALPTIDLRFERKSAQASGFDLMANIGMPRVISPGKRWLCHTGLYLGMPHGIEAQCRPRSGLARDWGITVLNSPGTIDSDYRGENMVILINHGDTEYPVHPGDRIAQLVFSDLTMGVVRVASRDDLGMTDRGSGAFGSSGR